ncbi:MAG TPA: diguanylate cyclase [Candidatus Dormibacteraeota bacterium]
MASCWNCEANLPADARYCPHCAHSVDDRRSSPLFIVDTTTGLFNQDFLQALSDQEANRAGRYHRPLSVLVCELNHADVISRELSRTEMLQLRRELGKVLAAAIRDTDTVCAMDSEEEVLFGVVLPETDYEGALDAADKVRRTVAAHEFETSGAWNRLTVSCGAATVHHERMGHEDLLATAAQALIGGRAEGPNRTHAVSPL